MRLIHFTGLENYLDCSKFQNIILSPNINNDYTYHLKKKIYYLSNNWQKNKTKIEKNVLKLREKLLLQLTRELNSINKVNFTKKDWEILIEPWLHMYLASNYFRWLIVNDLISIYKKFSYLEIKIKNKLPVFDTLQFYEFNHNDDVYNHLMFQSILEFKNKKKLFQKKIHIKKIFYLNNNFIYKIYTKIKTNFFFNIYENIILKFINIDTLINIRTKKINFLKLCLNLNILGFKGLTIFNRKKLINISNKNSYEFTKRKDIKLTSNSKNEFENYIFDKIKEDIPRVFIENFKDIKKLHEKKLIKINTIISDTHHRFNPIFKSWIAHRKNLNKNLKIITADHGGIYGGKSIFNYNNAISSVVFKHQKKVFKNQVSLPCLFLNKSKKVSNNKILIICKDIPKYPRHFLNGPMCEEIISEFKQVNNFIENTNYQIRKKIIIRPFTRRTGWNLDKKYEKIVGKRNMIYSNKDYNKLRDGAIIRIVNYPQTAFLESIINGPTFLLFNRKFYYEFKHNEKFMDILFKNKIAFENGKDLSNHLNKINPNILEWWNQKKIKESINIFMNNLNIYNENPIKSWAKSIKNISKTY
ncbi:hypothetical protein IDH27_03110 [Pelagibacterales bacterium SAG-MED46]|nr:hypothetical protein [Pelagibacterales bacterium SAG-MED46]